MGRPSSIAAAFLLISASAYGQPPSPQFDAVSVKVGGLEARTGVLFEGGPGTKNPGRFTAGVVTMHMLLTKAFDVGPDQIQGPKWLTDPSSAVSYNIEATMPPDTTKEQFLKMLQNMLAERFHLVFRRETRNFPGYDLVVDQGGPKFKEVESDPDAPASPDSKALAAAKRDEDGFPIVKGSYTISATVGSGPWRIKYQETTMAEFVAKLGPAIHLAQGKSALDGSLRPRVVDKTGLKGKYTFVLQYRSAPPPAELRALMVPRTNASQPGEPADPSGGGPDIFAAIQKQLGLRLNKTADVPLDYMVIESVEKTPTPN